MEKNSGWTEQHRRQEPTAGAEQPRVMSGSSGQGGVCCGRGGAEPSEEDVALGDAATALDGALREGRRRRRCVRWRFCVRAAECCAVGLGKHCVCGKKR
jgi:hypothetical protein